MRKFIITGVSLVALAAPSAAMADPGPLQENPDSPAYADLAATGDVVGLEDGLFDGSLMGEYNSRATHNGIVSSEQAHSDLGRGTSVQMAHALEGKGRLK
jgi:hypothetical protein